MDDKSEIYTNKYRLKTRMQNTNKYIRDVEDTVSRAIIIGVSEVAGEKE